MLLVLTNSRDVTADYLLTRLHVAQVSFIRIDTDTILEKLSLSYTLGKPILGIDQKHYSPTDFSNVWYRRPERLRSKLIPDTPEGLFTLDEWGESIEGFLAHIPRSRWMNHPAANSTASRKLEQLTNAQKLGLLVPETLLTQDEISLGQFFEKHNKEIIVKPLGRATIERQDGNSDSVIFTNRVTEHDIEDLKDLQSCPTLFQHAIPKKADVRITIVDRSMYAMELTAQDEQGNQRCDIRRNNMSDVSYRGIDIPIPIANKIARLMKLYELRFAAIDMVIGKDDRWYFLEVNPNGQWAWIDLYGGASIFEGFIGSFGCRQ